MRKAAIIQRSSSYCQYLWLRKGPPLVAQVPFGLGESQDTIGSTTDAILSPPRRGDREADGDGLENRFRASERGFESHPLRQGDAMNSV